MPDSVHPLSLHTFHIPVMGTGFTIDTPLRVARYGISSVISLVDDILMEQMRRHHCRAAGEPCEPIADDAPDGRARRITTYLNLLARRVAAQARTLQAEPFVPESDITRYFALLPDSPARDLYFQMLALPQGAHRRALEEELRRLAVPGSIDVNIMTKLEADSARGAAHAAPERSDAMAALRGFATSDLTSAVVFSAGLNRALYSYAATFADFAPQAGQPPRKRIILKVSDFRSAVIQGTFFAKHGLWLSEFRVESGLNCGGHAFPTKGQLLGPILQEFRNSRQQLQTDLRALYLEALRRRGLAAPPADWLTFRVTAQGGIGTAAEDRLLRACYQVDGTGWGTPFLLVPEAVNVDRHSLAMLAAATAANVELSDNSPLGVPFWSLRTSASEAARRQRIGQGAPGSACRKGYALLNTELTEQPVCVASRAYQALKLRQLAARHPQGAPSATETRQVVTKACICHDLAGSATLAHGLDPAATPAVCCGPNIAWFNRPASLEEMVGHIYGRLSLLAGGERPHMFISELRLYVAELEKSTAAAASETSERLRLYLRDFTANLLAGIGHYRHDVARLITEKQAEFLRDLETLEAEIRGLAAAPFPAAAPIPLNLA